MAHSAINLTEVLAQLGDKMPFYYVVVIILFFCVLVEIISKWFKISRKKVGIVFVALGAVALLVWSWKANMTQAAVDLGYYCLSCKKTDQFSVYQANWRQYPGAMSDSVLYCVHCDKGPAHPTNECDKCGSVFILHLFPKYDEFGSPSCPKCDAAYGQAAKVKKIDLMPKALNP